MRGTDERVAGAAQGAGEKPRKQPAGKGRKSRRPNNDGGITQIKKGKKAGYYVGTLSLPSGDRKYVYRRTEAELISAMNRLRGDLARGELVPTERTTLEAYLESWLEAIVPSVGYNTGISYRQRVARILKYSTIGRKRLSALTAMDVQRAVAALSARYAPETVRQSRGILVHALRDAVKWGIIPRNVAELTNSPKVPKLEPTTLSEEQVAILRDGSRGDYYHPLWCLMVTTGLRLGEATGLRWRDVDLKRGRISVGRTLYRIKGEGMQAAETKTAGARREVKLAPWVVELLKERKALLAELRLQWGERWNRGDFVFVTSRGTPVDPSNIHKVWDRTLARLGLPEVNLHDLRHTAASVLLRRKVHPKKVQALLGHSTIRTTMDRYSHLIEADADEAAEEMEALFGREGGLSREPFVGTTVVRPSRTARITHESR